MVVARHCAAPSLLRWKDYIKFKDVSPSNIARLHQCTQEVQHFFASSNNNNTFCALCEINHNAWLKCAVKLQLYIHSIYDFIPSQPAQQRLPFRNDDAHRVQQWVHSEFATFNYHHSILQRKLFIETFYMFSALNNTGPGYVALNRIFIFVNLHTVEMIFSQPWLL